MNSFMKQAAFASGSALALAPLAMIAQPAAAAYSCATTVPTATLIAPGVCQVSYTVAGPHTFNAPVGITKLSALLVGAGGGSTYFAGSYGGGGGAVVVYDDIDLSAPVTLVVGAGGVGGADSSSDGSDGQDTSVLLQVAAGGKGGNFGGGGASGNGNSGANVGDISGGGGGSAAAATTNAGGAGTKASSAGSGDELFPAISGEKAYGAGGSALTLNVSTPGIAGQGGNSFGLDNSQAGRDGAVFFRFAVEGSADELAETGMPLSNLALGALSAAAGASLIAFSRRRREN